MMYQSAPSRWPSDNTSVSLIACLEVKESRGKQKSLLSKIATVHGDYVGKDTTQEEQNLSKQSEHRR